MRQHHTFRFASRAGGVDDRRQIIRPGVRYRSIDVAGLALFKLAAFFFELGQRYPFRACDSFSLEENDVLDLRTFTERVFQLIKLVSILEKKNAGARVVQYVTDLRWR